MTMRYAIAMLALGGAAIIPAVVNAAVATPNATGTCNVTVPTVTFAQGYNVIRGVTQLSTNVSVSVAWSNVSGNRTLTVDMAPSGGSLSLTNGALAPLNYKVFYPSNTTSVLGNGQNSTTHYTLTQNFSNPGTPSPTSFVITVTVPSGQDPKVASTPYTDSTPQLTCTIS